MDDFLEQVAFRRRQGLFTVLYYLMWLGVILFGIMALFSLPNILAMNADGGFMFSLENLIAAVLFGGIAFLLWRRADYCRMEYDYSFTNGTLDISRVLNNKRRRYLTALEMKEVIRCGPAQGPAFDRSLKESGVKIHNWFVNRDANLYFFYFVKKGVKHLCVVELTGEMVSLIRSRGYLPKEAWFDKDGKQNYGYGVS